MTDVAMLAPESAEYVGKKLLVSPIYGWGWSDDQPADFQMRLVALDGEAADRINGGYGEIAQPGHKYDGYFAVFSLQHLGVWNFTNAIGDYSICIFKELPADWHAIAVYFRPSALPRTYSTCGFARIGLPP